MSLPGAVLARLITVAYHRLHHLLLLPEDGEVAGLLALMLLTEARRPDPAR